MGKEVDDIMNIMDNMDIMKKYIKIHNEKLKEVCELAMENNEKLIIQNHIDINEIHIITISECPVLYIKNYPPVYKGKPEIETTYEYFSLYFEWKNKRKE